FIHHLHHFDTEIFKFVLGEKHPPELIQEAFITYLVSPKKMRDILHFQTSAPKKLVWHKGIFQCHSYLTHREYWCKLYHKYARLRRRINAQGMASISCDAIPDALWKTHEKLILKLICFSESLSAPIDLSYWLEANSSQLIKIILKLEEKEINNDALISL